MFQIEFLRGFLILQTPRADNFFIFSSLVPLDNMRILVCIISDNFTTSKMDFWFRLYLFYANEEQELENSFLSAIITYNEVLAFLMSFENFVINPFEDDLKILQYTL